MPAGEISFREPASQVEHFGRQKRLLIERAENVFQKDRFPLSPEGRRCDPRGDTPGDDPSIRFAQRNIESQARLYDAKKRVGNPVVENSLGPFLIDDRGYRTGKKPFRRTLRFWYRIVVKESELFDHRAR